MTGTIARRGPIAGLAVLFGLLYFVQGIAEPTEGLIAQPVRSLLIDWQYPAASIGQFAAMVSLPWSIKPLFGLLSDFVPLFGRRRKSYLLLSSGIASVSLLGLYWFSPQSGSIVGLLVWLLVPTTAVAISDVVIDALMVEKGQPLGMTGQLQSVQWAAMYSAMILTGSLGGWLAQRQLQSVGFLICGLLLLPTIVLVALFVREPVQPLSRSTVRDEFRQLVRTARRPVILAIAAFLLLLNFNPFSVAVLQSYMTEELKWDEQFYGHTVSLQAIGSVVASLAYASYCRRVSSRWLVHLAILQGVLATASYWLMGSQTSAVCVSLCVGFTYMTATLVQLDLAARVCPPQVSATVFASLMSITNIGIALSYYCGGHLYDWIAEALDRPTAFHLLVGIGAATTAACWLLAPLLARQLAASESEQGAECLPSAAGR
jgi:MFS family permease